MNTIYWLWFTLKDDLTEKDRRVLLEKYETPKNIYNASKIEDIVNLSEKAEKAVMDKSLAMAETVKQKVERMGGYILTIEDEEYPLLLKEIYAPPYVLYLRGEHLDWENLLTITMVGTRTNDEYGRKVTEHIARGLSMAGVTIVSGMARGIDSIAGIEAIRCGGKTVAVLGSGLDVIYPPEHANLYESICKNGVVITEYPPGTRPNKENFPKRNRIMAGLSRGIVVTQAPKKSGALITANFAIENNRDLFTVPANIFKSESEGSNALTRQGAKAVMSAEDIICEYPYITLVPLAEKAAEKARKSGKKEPDISGLNELQAKIVRALGDGKLHIDKISREVGVAGFEVSSELVVMELQGLVRMLNGNIYELV